MAEECQNEKLEHSILHEAAIVKALTFHLLALNICCFFTCVAVAISVWQILHHALHYLRPYEQKHIIRILAIVPIYAVTSFFSLVFYTEAVYWQLVRNCYEAYAIASLFTLLSHYVAPTLHEQKAYFRDAKPKNWAAPLNWLQKLTGGEQNGGLRKPLSGLTWFNIVYVGIFQYCATRPVTTLIGIITESQDKFCQGSPQPQYASLWVQIIDAVSIIIAMYCLAQFYLQLKDDLAAHKPFLKLISTKLVVFLVFWQNSILRLLVTQEWGIKPTAHIAGPDQLIGITSLLTCFEMAIFAFLHRWAFPWKVYDIDRLPRFPEQFYEHDPLEALWDAINPWDYMKGIGRAVRWLFHGVHLRRNDASYDVYVPRTDEKERMVSDPMYEMVDKKTARATDPVHETTEEDRTSGTDQTGETTVRKRRGGSERKTV